MSYTLQQRDVTTITKGFILHGVNCQGAMGSGIAGAIARKWPIVRDLYLAYVHDQRQRAGFQSEQLLGNVQLVKAGKNLTIANCFPVTIDTAHPGCNRSEACKRESWIRQTLSRILDHAGLN